MGLPSIDISFREAGAKALERGKKGTVALILEDTLQAGAIEISGITEIPTGLNDFNKKQVELAFLGYQTPPKKIILYIVPVGTELAPVSYTEAKEYLETVKWNYLAIPEISEADVPSIGTWIKSLRSTKRKKVKAVLPNHPGDHEGIINVTTAWMKTKDQEYTAAEYCARIAGLLSGTPLSIASTFAPLPEVIDCEKLTIEEYNSRIDAGEFMLYHDGEKVKVARGVNSLVTTTESKLNSFKKIKIVETMDLIYDDIRMTAEDNYLGKYANSYDNKCLLITAVKGYLEGLEREGVLLKGASVVEIDMDAQKAYLKATGYAVEEMSTKEIKEAETDDKVFLKASIKILDAIEDITLPIAI